MAKKKTAKKKSASKSASKKRGSSRAATAHRRCLNCLPSPQPDTDWLVSDVEEAGIGLPDEDALPSSVDLRESWWTISDQKQTGSCVGWAVADSALRWYFVKAGSLAEDEALSIRFIWMSAKEIDEHHIGRPESFIEDAGTSLKAGLDIARKYGCVADELLPFEGELYPGSSRAFYIAAARLRISMYIRLQTLQEWKRWLADQGPLLIRVETDRNWYSPTDGRLEFYDPFSAGDPRAGGHAAAVVGYTQHGDYIIRNSWGVGWGQDGFALATPLYVDRAVSETFGVFV